MMRESLRRHRAPCLWIPKSSSQAERKRQEIRRARKLLRLSLIEMQLVKPLVLSGLSPRC